VVLVVFGGGIRRTFNEVVRFEGDGVEKEITAGKREVPDEEVEEVVGILDAGNGDGSDVINVGGMTILISPQSSGLNFKIPRYPTTNPSST